ncbi:putative nuclease HARBI1 [Alosa sapidissima]|uniref:putative nuclease HARBI1 n=1 Tax=Alosa sapidissima TaxID=34773 RepID=UPI001C0A2E4C|nr:putative nuclease HARBI1 [Alosa sapidissima]
MTHLFITFPGHRRLRDIKEEFYRIAGANEADYVNRKSFHSINVQIVCNADCLISNVVAKWPGSVHDSRVFRTSDIHQRLSQGEFSGVLLGDKGYGCRPSPDTLYRPPGSTAGQDQGHS